MALERLRIVVDAVAGTAVRDLEAVGASATKLGVQTNSMNATTRSASGGLASMGGIATIAGAGIAVLGVAAFKAAGAYAELGTKVRQFRDIAGVSADTASRWVAVADDFEIASESAARAMGRLARNTKDGGDSLQEFGVDLAYTRDGNVDLQGTVENVADAMVRMGPGADRTRLLLQAFGRQGAELIPILEKGKAGIRELFAAVPEGQLLDNKDLDQARKFKLAMDDLNDAFREIVIGLGSVVAGPISEFASGFAGAVRVIGDVDDAFGGLLGTAAKAAVFLPWGIVDFAEKIGATVPHWDKASTRVEFYTEKIKGLEATHDPLGQLTSMQQELAKAEDEAAAAGTKFREAHDGMGPGLAAATAELQAHTAAIYAEIDAQLAAEGSLLAVQSAQKSYNIALFTHGAASLEARTAHHNLEVAQLRAADANKTHRAELLMLAAGLAPGSSVRRYIRDLIRDLNNIPRNINTEVRIRNGVASGGGVTRRASGGPASGLTWLGEEGPELVNLPSGSMVHSNRASMAMAGAGAGIHLTANINLYGTVLGGDARQIVGAIGPELHRFLLDKQATGSLGFTSSSN